jgi:hypothetical protein
MMMTMVVMMDLAMKVIEGWSLYTHHTLHCASAQASAVLAGKVLAQPLIDSQQPLAADLMPGISSCTEGLS